MTDIINTSAIESFIQQVKIADSAGVKEVRLDVKQAKNLAYTLGIVMSRLHGDIESMVSEAINTQTVTVSMDGGDNW